MTQLITFTPGQKQLFKQDVEHYVRGTYMLPGGQLVQGQSLTHLRQCLRMGHNGRRWALPSHYHDFLQALAAVGYKRVRAHTMRYTRKGEFKPYQICDVIVADQPVLATPPG